MTTVYKICSRSEWTIAERTGWYDGSEVDRRDGFVHLSDASQVRETARRHFAGQADLEEILETHLVGGGRVERLMLPERPVEPGPGHSG